MALYFDGVHLTSDSNLKELHDFAVNILTLQRSWFQDIPDVSFPHYDVLGYKKRMLNGKFASHVIMLDNRQAIVDMMHRFREVNPKYRRRKS